MSVGKVTGHHIRACLTLLALHVDLSGEWQQTKAKSSITNHQARSEEIQRIQPLGTSIAAGVSHAWRTIPLFALLVFYHKLTLRSPGISITFQDLTKAATALWRISTHKWAFCAFLLTLSSSALYTSHLPSLYLKPLTQKGQNLRPRYGRFPNKS